VERDRPRDDEDRHDAPEWADPSPDADGVEWADSATTAPGTNSALPPRVEAWRKRSAAGAILTGFALGLQEALEKRKEDSAIVMETSGDPPKDLPVEAEFEYGRPRQSVVHIRPWLLPHAAEALGTSSAADTTDAAGPADTAGATGSVDPDADPFTAERRSRPGGASGPDCGGPDTADRP
jgi:hypothetical protein